MKTAVISDVHGNLVALDAVLKALEKEPYDRLVFLGDAAATGPEPHDCIARLRAKDPLCIMGNTDEWLLDPVPRENPDPQTKVIEEIDYWCADQLTRSDRDYLRSFKPTERIGLGEDASLLAFHGSPKSNKEGVSPVGTVGELEAVLLGGKATVMAGGHTHVQMLRRYRDSLLLNPGSVGLPVQRDHATGKVSIPPWAELAVISFGGGRLDVSLKRVPVTPSDVARSMDGSGMPHKKEFLQTWTAVVGRMLARDGLA